MKRFITGLFACAACFAAGAGGKKYIAFGWEFRNLSPAQILANADRFKGLPIDGVGIVLSAKNPKGGRFSQITITDDKPWVWEAFAGQVPVLQELVGRPGLKDSFLQGYRAPMRRADWTDDTVWATIANNMGVLARIARESGIKGISIDHEDYRMQRQYYRKSTDPAYDECCALARRRGRQVFEAVFREHPSAILLSFWVLTEDRSYFATRAPAALMRQKGDLWPSFMAGVLDALPPTGRLIEGDEHGYRYEYFDRDFHVGMVNAKKWGAMLLPEELRAKYASRVEQGYGQYLDLYTHPFDPGKRAKWSVGPIGGSRLEHFRRNIQDATDLASEYVWLWGEQYTWVDWDKDARRNAAVVYDRNWEDILPGLNEMLSVVKGGDAAEAARLGRLKAAGAVTNLLARLRVKSWQPVKDTKGRPWPQGTLRMLDGGIAECKGVRQGCFYCDVPKVTPGEKYAIGVRKRGSAANAGVTWGDQMGASYRTPSPQAVFSEPGPDGWSDGVMYLTVPEGIDHLRFTFGAGWQEPGDRVEFKDWSMYRLW
jgi:hypothetical protein